MIVTGLGALTILGVVWLLATSDADGRAPSLDLRACSPAEESHLARIYQQVFEDRERFYDFDGLERLRGERKLELKRAFTRVWPLEITCGLRDACPYGANTRGWVIGGDAGFTMCAYTKPHENDCDTYAGIAFANAYTRGLKDSEAGPFFAYARQLCLARRPSGAQPAH